MEELWQIYDLEALQSGVDSLFPEYGISLQQLMEKLMQGEFGEAFRELWQGLLQGITGQGAGLRELFLWLVIMGTASALLGFFTEIFDKKQIADFGFYIMYLLLAVVLLKCFEQAADTAVDALRRIIGFMKLLIPVLLIAVGVVHGTITGGSWYQLMVFLIYGAEQLFLTIVIPMIYGYGMLVLVNGIWAEQKLNLLLELLAKGIRSILKASVGVVTGISVFQAALAPAVDSVHTGVWKKILSFLPGVGNAAEGVTDLVIGSAVLIRNCIGIAAVLLLAVLCAAPLLRILLIGSVLKLAAAMMGIVGSRRLTECTDRIGDGSMLLCRTAGAAFLLFAISISAAALSLNRGG